MRVTCVLNACHTRSVRGSDACVIELVAGLYRSYVLTAIAIYVAQTHAASYSINIQRFVICNSYMLCSRIMLEFC